MAETSAGALMTTGGDARIRLDPASGLNRYHSAPRPSAVLAYASSTANDVSPAAYAHAERLAAGFGPGLDAQGYGDGLEQLRGRLRSAYALPDVADIVFAPSGTDLEYVALAAVQGRGAGGTHNILLGADEVGSGCIHSAFGRYFANETALDLPVTPGTPVAGLGGTSVEMIDIPVRDDRGRAQSSEAITAAMGHAIGAAVEHGRHVLVHVVHGSKTGLILPAMGDIDRLQERFGQGLTFVVDACQARITSPALAAYLERGAIVFLTGSKFMGGPPFSGFAVLPRSFREQAPPLAPGLAAVFRRAEWPAAWPGREALANSANPGLLLRLETAIFELERFQRLTLAEVTRVILAFHQAVRDHIVDKTPARRVAPYPPGQKETADTHPVEMRTLSTLDLSGFGGGATFADSVRWHRQLLDHEVRLGQPVKCVRRPDGEWGATLRIGLSMPMVVERAALDDATLHRSFAADMARVREALEAVAG